MSLKTNSIDLVMEKHLNPYDKEHMRLAMLKHEEAFRAQVLELHRLYQTQKMLMKHIQRVGRNNQEQPPWNFKKCMDKIEGLDLGRPAVEENNNNAENHCHKNDKMVDESELLELSLGPSNNFYRRRKEADDAPLSLLHSVNYSGTNLSSSSSNNHHHHQQKMNISTQQSNNQKWNVDTHVPIKSNHHNFLGEMKIGGSNVASEGNWRQDRSLKNNPPWLFQGLSLKMT
ncbi:hypothetical protein Leryth_007027 [Lithospermum erythrorhizon]|nr:hypothetical protein Leryth_007027 [Lithospermum erythrorhizon]